LINVYVKEITAKIYERNCHCKKERKKENKENKVVKIKSKIQDNGSKYIACDWQYEKLMMQWKKKNLNKINILKVKVQSKNVHNGNGTSSRNSFPTLTSRKPSVTSRQDTITNESRLIMYSRRVLKVG
jgi:hypothetical protein